VRAGRRQSELVGADVIAATLTRGGGLSRDREFALFDASGYVNGKREPRVHALRVSYDEAFTRADSEASSAASISASNSNGRHERRPAASGARDSGLPGNGVSPRA
jgi:uncharacterized protein YcbX